MKIVVNAYMSILIEGVAEALELAGTVDAGHGREDVSVARLGLANVNRGGAGS